MIRIGLYGTNGHQIQNSLIEHSLARLVASAGIPLEKLPRRLVELGTIRMHKSLDELIEDPEVDFISLCSPRRIEQASDAIRALRGGKHVLAEKPCAMNEAAMDSILAAALESGKIFHEMAGTSFTQPYPTIREVVRNGRIGEIVQVIAEKSYPYYLERAQDEDEDGGLILQNGVHAFRFVEHVACTPIASVLAAVETTRGNPLPQGGLRMAASILLTLKNGGIASLSANYLNPQGTGVWGNESLRILGTLGFVESQGGGTSTRLVIGGEDLGALELGKNVSWLDSVFNSILGHDMPLTLEEELSPTRWAIRAKEMAKG